MSANRKNPKAKRTRLKRVDPDYVRSRFEERVRVRRKVCSLFGFWRACGYQECLRARRCARASNDCFDGFWPLVPQETKICLRAGVDARIAGLSGPEISAAITRAMARWRETQASAETISCAPERATAAPASESQAAAPPRRIAAPAPPNPRLRVL